MIVGGTSWTNQLNAQTKRPLYTFTIAGKSIFLASFNPVSLAVNAGSYLPILNIPTGATQKVDELNGTSSISTLNITAVDNTGALKSLASDQDAIGQFAQLLMGFPGLDVTDPTQFVPIHSGIIQKIGRSAEGLMTFSIQDILVNLSNQIFLNGGPATWTNLTAASKVQFVSNNNSDTRLVKIVGWNSTLTAIQVEQIPINGTTPVQSINTYGGLISVTANVGSQLWTITVSQVSGGGTLGTIPIGSTLIGGPIGMPAKPPSYLDNGYPIDSSNKRYISGNPIDIGLAVMQNELGIGQSLPPVLVVNTGDGSGTGIAGFGINPSWTFYNGSSGLINPNTYVRVSDFESLRDNDFNNDRFEFIYDTAQVGKSWSEDQLWRVCGIYLITRGNGQLSPKTMKMADPNAMATLLTLNDHHISGIPTIDVWPIINQVIFTVPVDDGSSGDTTNIPFAQQNSLDFYKATYNHEITADGIRLGLGGFTRMFQTANRILARHAFGTVEYTFTAQLRDFVLELGDLFVLTHPKLLDMKTGTVGVTNVVCEVTDRTPNFSKGNISFKAIDTRYIQPSTGFGIGTNGVPNATFQLANLADAIPVWGSASSAQKSVYMFCSDNNGHMSTGAAGNEIH